MVGELVGRWIGDSVGGVGELVGPLTTLSKFKLDN